MALHDITSYMLIESPTDESDELFLTAVEDLLQKAKIVRKRVEWERFSAGARFARGGTTFREFICIAGSALAQLWLRASRDGGIPRAIILRGEVDGKPKCWEIRDGVEKEFDLNELQVG